MTSFKLTVTDDDDGIEKVLEIFKCADCPKNKSFPNPLYVKLGMTKMADMAATHSCSATFPERLLLNHHIIPTWCPFIQKKEGR